MSTEPALGRHVPLKMVVAYFLDQYDMSDGDEDKLWIIALRGLVELNYDISAEPKTVRLPVGANMTVQYPSDLLTWIKIGILDSNGQVSTLKINNALTTFRDTNPARLGSLNSPDITDTMLNMTSAPIFFNYYNNGYYNNFYGIGGGLVQYGECRVDDKNGVIILAPDFKYSSILLEYISSPERDEDYKVPLVLQEAVIAWLAWKTKKGSAQEFYGEVTKSRRRLPGKKITLQEVNQYIRESSGGYLHA
jgi:hypothetical protein